MKKKINIVARIGLLLIFLVILAGSVVRMTGSGMGCPDWPKCFGQWIPPTDVDQLPENYKEVYVQKRAAKIDEFAQLLERIGFTSEANKIRGDETLLEEEDFNATKTWIEYVNRLAGFLAGNFFLLAVVLSAFLIRKKKSLFIIAFINLIIIGFQAWFGSIVVATNLLPWTITIHMLLALVIIVIHLQLIRLSSTATSSIVKTDNTIKTIFIVATIMTIAQIFMGTQIRQEVDIMLSNGVSRSEIPENFDMTFYIHRTFSILILLINIYLIYRLKNQFNKVIKGITAIVLTEIILGVIMFYGSMPAWTQPIHLTLATILFALQSYWILEQFSNKRNTASQNLALKHEN